MTTTVLRYRCDLCSKLWLMQAQAELCEAMCAEQEAQGTEAGTAETPESGSVQRRPGS